MTTGPQPHSGRLCPLCTHNLSTWERDFLEIESCRGCGVVFLDRGELYKLYHSEGHRCPPEAFLRARFTPGEGETLACPKCRTASLAPGHVEGCEVWHCTPCNSFMVEWALVIGAGIDDAPLEGRGFRPKRPKAARTGPASGSVAQLLERFAFLFRSASRELE
jgi:Zn-finger nucleic acid-binding protein